MKGKFGIAALLLSSITFAAPVSTPNPNISDTPIISGGGTVSGGTSCRAYQTNSAVVPLQGGETLVFYGSGVSGNYPPIPLTTGGYLSTKSNYSGTAYVRVKGYDFRDYIYYYPGGAIGLFARNSDSRNDFIAGAGAGANENRSSFSHGGGWTLSGLTVICTRDYHYERPIEYCYTFFIDGPSIYKGAWFSTRETRWWRYPAAPGFHGAGSILYACPNSYCAAVVEVYHITGGASSISAFYNSYTKNYTSVGNSLTISAGGFHGQTNPTLYVCQ